MTIKAQREKERGRRFFQGLSREQRNEIGDELVLGAFDWREWMDRKPTAAFLNGVDEERIRWETMESNPRCNNPIKGMPGGSVSGCITKMKRRGDIDDPGAYCAAIADRIEPGWRSRRSNLIGSRSMDWSVRYQLIGQYWLAIDEAIERAQRTGMSWPHLEEKIDGIVAHFGGDRYDAEDAIEHARERFEEGKGRMDVDARLEFNPLFRHRGHTVDIEEEDGDWFVEVWGDAGKIAEFEADSMEEALERGRAAVDAHIAKVANPGNGRQRGLFGERQTEVEGFALVSEEGEVGHVRPPKGEQQFLVEPGKPSREVMGRKREEELRRRAKRKGKKKRKKNVAELRRRLLR